MCAPSEHNVKIKQFIECINLISLNSQSVYGMKHHRLMRRCLGELFQYRVQSLPFSALSVVGGSREKHKHDGVAVSINTTMYNNLPSVTKQIL